MKGCRRPKEDLKLSDTVPMTGSVTASIAVAIINASHKASLKDPEPGCSKRRVKLQRRCSLDPLTAGQTKRKIL